MTTLEDRLAALLERIAQATHQAGRPAGAVRLLAASKSQPPEEISAAVRAGMTLFGESKVQEARAKIPLCPSSAEWHFIGHLQTNKVRDAVALFGWVHSVDSLRLAESLQAECEKQARRLDILLEVNVSGERSKWGLDPARLPEVCAALAPFSRLTLRGLMTVAPFHADPQKARPDFERLRLVRDRMERDTGWKLPELSMGMSHDFEAAIAEGATLVRIGSLLFGERPKTARQKVSPDEQEFVG